MMEINVNVRAIEKLVDYTASGIGSTASFFFSRMVARRDAKVRAIAAEGEVEAQRIVTERRATSMQIVAAAQAEARSKLISPQAALQGEVTIGELIEQRVQFQEEKRQANIGAVVAQAAQELGDGEVQDHEVDHDWTARFFNDVQDVSSEEMQRLWSKVLAGEVERPGSTSIKTLELLKNLDRTTASLFGKLCSLCVFLGTGSENDTLEGRVPSLGGNAPDNALRDYGVTFGDLNVLNEFGLIISDYNSWRDIQVAIGLEISNTGWMHIPFRFQNRYWILIANDAGIRGKEFRLSGVALTRSGHELSRVVKVEPEEQYAQNLRMYFERNRLKIVEVDSWEPQVLKE